MEGEKRQVFLMGIGGIGMSALARYFRMQGCDVAGYDKTPSHLTESLQQLGVDVTFSTDLAFLENLAWDWPLAEVVCTPAVPRNHPFFAFFNYHESKLVKRAEAVGRISRDLFTVAVAGTHGKTTTTAIVAHLLKSSGKRVLAFVGGVMSNYGTNLLADESPEVMVVEADEFDRSFLHLHPDIAIITSCDADHLDIYGEADALQQAFRDFAALIPKTGQLILHDAVSGIDPETEPVRYGFDTNDNRISEYRIQSSQVHFRWAGIGWNWNLPGRYNTANAVAALCAVRACGLDTALMEQALTTFAGVKRRFEYHLRASDLVVLDDYAHHPTEIKALYGSLREMYPDKRICAVFQPHLFSRTRDFLGAFAEALAPFDQVVLLPVYAAREAPIAGGTSENLQMKMQHANCRLLAPEMVAEYLFPDSPDVIVTVGAGDVYQIIPELLLKYRRS